VRMLESQEGDLRLGGEREGEGHDGTEEK